MAENESTGDAGNGVSLSNISEGKVKWYNAEKGYGFIEVPDSTGDIFLHVKELRKSSIIALNDGASVSFTTAKGPKGLYATDIKVLSTKVA